MTTDRFEGDVLERWLAALADGSLSVDEHGMLMERLRNDAAARSRYVSYLMLHGMLAWEFAPAVPLPAGQPTVPAVAKLNPGGPQTVASRRRPVSSVPPHPHRRWQTASGLVAGFAAALMISWAIARSGPPPAPAVLTGVDAPVWVGSQPLPGARLQPGSLQLAAGLAQLRFHSGAIVLIEGPAELEIRSGMAMTLRSGRVVARAPLPAHGFAIDAAGARITDLGSEFGVSLVPGEPVAVRVFAGAIEVAAGLETKPVHLPVGQAVRVDASKATVEPDAGAGLAFTRAMPSELDGSGLSNGTIAWWRLDEKTGTQVADASGHGHHGTLIGATFEQATAERATGGRPSGALACDGKGVHVTIPHHSDFDLAEMTIQAWVRPATPQAPDAQILSKEGAYGLALPRNGALKFYFWNADNIISRPFDSGRWYHLCMVYDGMQRQSYVDGVLEIAVSSPRPLRSEGELQIGSLRGRVGADSCSFNGLIDEVRMWSRALSSDEVRRLYLGQAGGQASGQQR